MMETNEQRKYVNRNEYPRLPRAAYVQEMETVKQSGPSSSLVASVYTLVVKLLGIMTFWIFKFNLTSKARVNHHHPHPHPKLYGSEQMYFSTILQHIL